MVVLIQACTLLGGTPNDEELRTECATQWPKVLQLFSHWFHLALEPPGKSRFAAQSLI